MSDDPTNLPRVLTTDDLIQLWYRTPDGRVGSYGGRFDGLTVFADGTIGIDYVFDDEEGFANSTPIAWITRIQLSDEATLSGPPQPPPPDA